jgi:hypothetical protein
MQRKFPQVRWQEVWKNINVSFLPWKVRTAWYTVVQDMIPTYERLHKINLQKDDRCKRCNEQDTLIHRITGCEESRHIWNGTRRRIACYLRTDIREMTGNWVRFPDFTLWPQQRHNATIWYIIANNAPPTKMDYMDFMRRARWKVHNRRKGYPDCRKYLEVLEY